MKRFENADSCGIIRGWMDRNGYTSIGEFKGSMSKRHNSDPRAYTRAHYARLLMDPKPITQNYPTMQTR